jgi:hypothetical protein
MIDSRQVRRAPERSAAKEETRKAKGFLPLRIRYLPNFVMRSKYVPHVGKKERGLVGA